MKAGLSGAMNQKKTLFQAENDTIFLTLFMTWPA